MSPFNTLEKFLEETLASVSEVDTLRMGFVGAFSLVPRVARWHTSVLVVSLLLRLRIFSACPQKLILLMYHAKISGRIGLIWMSEKRLTAALGSLKQAMEIADSDPFAASDPRLFELKGQLLAWRGRISHDAKTIDSCFRASAEAFEVSARMLADMALPSRVAHLHWKQADVLGELGEIQGDTDYYRKAIELATTASAYFTLRNEALNAAAMHSKLAYFHMMISELDGGIEHASTSLKYHSETLKTYRTSGLHLTAGEVLMNRALSYLTLFKSSGCPNELTNAKRDAIEASRYINNSTPNLATVLRGNILAIMAEEVKIDNSTYALQKFFEVVASAREHTSLSSPEKRSIFDVLMFLVVSKKLLEHRDAAITAGKELVAISRKYGDLPSYLTLLTQVCRIEFSVKDIPAALSTSKRALSAAEVAVRDQRRGHLGKLEAVHQVSDLHGMKAVCVLRTGTPGEDAIWQAALAAEAGRARLSRDAISAEVPEGVTTPEALADAAPEGGALVLPVITASESLAFVIRRDGPPEVVELPDLTSDTLQARFNGEDGWIAAQGAVAAAGRGFQRGVPAYTDWNAHLDAQAAWLHAHLLAPLEDRLDSLGLRPSGSDYPGDPVVLLPTGLLGLLPLGAARAAPDDPAFAERWPLTLAPSAAMLAACRSRATERDARPCQLLGLFNPTGDLPGASREAEFVSAHLNGLSDDRMRLLRGRDATRDAALAGAGNVSHLLLSCHGVHDAIVPKRSGLQLFDDRPREPLNPMPPGRLALGDLRDLRLKARLVQMSACESGVAGVRKAPDEFVGLPVGVLAAGAAAAIGTLWSVNDDTAATFSTRFLAAHLNSDGTQRMAPAEAFHETQRWLRNVTVDKLKTNQAWYWRGSAALKGSAVQQNNASSRDLGGSTFETIIAKHSGTDRPFKDPHNWAAFTYTGV